LVVRATLSNQCPLRDYCTLAMMITIVARCALLVIMCLALVYYQKVDHHAAVLYKDHPNYYSDDERYLVADDDRHNNGPNENNVTNFPMIFGFSRAPSTSPTVITLSPSPTVRPSSSSAPSTSPTSSSSPTMIPSTLPSQYPSLSPSISLQPSVSIEPSMVPSLQPSASAKPSSIPTSMPSLDACKAYDGVFGNVNAVDKVRVSFNYGIETDMTIQNTLSSQIFSVEAELLNLLIQQLILSCQSIDTSLILSADTLDSSQSMATSRSSLESFSPTFAPSMVNTNAPSGSPTESVVGLSSRPVDMPFGGEYQLTLVDSLDSYASFIQYIYTCMLTSNVTLIFLKQPNVSLRFKKETATLWKEKWMYIYHQMSMQLIHGF